MDINGGPFVPGLVVVSPFEEYHTYLFVTHTRGMRLPALSLGCYRDIYVHKTFCVFRGIRFNYNDLQHTFTSAIIMPRNISGLHCCI